MKELAEHLQTPMINLLLSIADDKLFLGHRNSDWTGIAPILEADIAFSSLAQDDIAHASAIYELINSINGHDLDDLIPILRNIKNTKYNGPILVHVVTKKGKGYKPAEDSRDRFEGPHPKSEHRTSGLLQRH